MKGMNKAAEKLKERKDDKQRQKELLERLDAAAKEAAHPSAKRAKQTISEPA